MLNLKYDPFDYTQAFGSEAQARRGHSERSRTMNRRKRPFWFLILSLLSLAAIIYLIVSFNPSSKLHLPLEALAKWGITNYQLPVLPIFFLLLFTFCLSLAAYLSRNLRRATTIGLLIITYLIFRMLHLNSPYFLLLLIALFITLELFFKKRI